MKDHEPLVCQAARKLRRASSLRPRLAMVLGSGFQGAVEGMEVAAEIPYEKIPGFPRVGVAGHVGRAMVGRLGGTPVVVLCGRVHYYEGYDFREVTFGVRMLAEMGVEALLLTNAAGGIRRGFRPGDFMILEDHINLMGANPLRGPAPKRGPRFVDLSSAYDVELRKQLRRAGRKLGLALKSGVYLAVSGPSYETPAEIRAFARLGADAVGMSTVPEVIVARQCGLRVAGLSCITNVAAGISKHGVSHEEVLATGARVRQVAGQLLAGFARGWERKKED